jgi:hypothetical protein
MRVQTQDTAGNDTEFEFSDRRYAMLADAIKARAPHILDGIRRRGADGDPLAHVISQLAFLENEALRKEYEPLIYKDLLGECITSEAGEWAKTIDIETIDITARGARIDPESDRIPMADVRTNKRSITVALGGIGYAYSLEDLRISARLLTPLPQSKQEAAVIGCETHLNEVAIQGETESNFTGLFNNASVPSGNRPSAAAWTSATADTILSDINAGLSNVYTNSKMNHHATAIALPPSVFQYLAKPRATGTDLTVLAWLAQNNLATLMTGKPMKFLSGGTYLETAGASTSKRVVFYSPNRDKIKFHVPMGLRFEAPQPHMLKFVVPANYKYGPVDWRKAYTGYYMDGV